MDDVTTRLLGIAERLIDSARQAGADACDVAVVQSSGRSASVRLGQVESVDASESQDLSLRVFVGRRVAAVSADIGPGFEPGRIAERAVAMARVSPEDPYAGLADPALLSRDHPDLDLFDPTELSGDALAAEALAVEAAARDHPGISNSGGGSASAGSAGLVLATSTGFFGARRRSSFGRSVSVIAGEGTGMQRDYDFDGRIHHADLEDAAAIGRRAAERTVRRLNPGSVSTGRYEIVFDPRLSRGLLGSLVQAVNGAGVARRTTFLKDMMGRRILPAGISVLDEPLLPRRPGSRAFDGEGVRGGTLALVEDGTLRHWTLDTATAKELGLPATNGRASRSGAGVSPTSTNVSMTLGSVTPAELVADVGRGIYVTELIGSGTNLVTGDYSRGASGFLIENGEITAPVSEFTVAGNLAEMLLALRPADDGDERFSVVAPTLHVGAMTVAGR